jgi:hypothetical protein
MFVQDRGPTMRNFRDSKEMATVIRDELAARGLRLSRAESLEIVAKAFGIADWNTLAAMIKRAKTGAAEAPQQELEAGWPEVARPYYERYLTPEERGGQWARLFDRARTLFETKTDATSDDLLELALRWVKLADATTGGDRELRVKYAAAYRDALADPKVAPKLPLSRELLDWFAPALKRAAALRSELLTEH